MTPPPLPQFDSQRVAVTRKKFNLVWLFYGILGLALALVLPDTSASYPQIIFAIASGFVDKIPTANRLVELTQFPGAMTVWWFLMWLALPLAVWKAGLQHERTNCKSFFLSAWNKSAWLTPVALVIVPLAIYFLLIFGVANFVPKYDGSHGRAGVSLIVDSRFGLGFIGSMLMACAGALVGWLAAHAVGIYDILKGINK
jgi:hypothetical protein